MRSAVLPGVKSSSEGNLSAMMPVSIKHKGSFKKENNDRMARTGVDLGAR